MTVRMEFSPIFQSAEAVLSFMPKSLSRQVQIPKNV
jgi:hypothetical protein